MTMIKLLAAAAAVGGLAAPVAAQVPYGYPQNGYPQNQPIPTSTATPARTAIRGSTATATRAPT